MLSDNDNYYFFRGLNNGDNSDLDNNIARDINGKILKVRTDRERYEGNPKYHLVYQPGSGGKAQRRPDFGGRSVSGHCQQRSLRPPAYQPTDRA